MSRYVDVDKLHYKRVSIVSSDKDGSPHCSSAVVLFADEIDKKSLENKSRKKCSFQDNVTIKPDGVNELDPCIYETQEEYVNVTVRVLKCKHCGHIEIEWERQEDTIEVADYE